MKTPPRAFWASPEVCGRDDTPTPFFKDRDPVWLRVDSPDAGPEASADFLIAARHARGRWTPWQTVQTLRGVKPGGAGRFTAAWRLENWDQLDRWAFANFRFTATIRDGEQTRRARSGLLRHHAGTVGFYGFGPVGDRWSNAEVRQVAREVGAVAIRARKPWSLRRLARQVPPGARGLRLYGYSLGGRAAVRFARWLHRRGIEVEALIGIDPVDLAAPTLIVPPNVRRAVSFYQRNGARIPLLAGPAGRGRTFTAAGAATAVENRRVERWRVGEKELPVMHEDMPRALRAEVIGRLRAGR